MPVTSKAQTQAAYQQRPLQPGNLAVNRRARGENREEEVEQSSENTAHHGPIGEQEGPEIWRRGGKFVRHVRSRNEGREYQRQQPCIAVFHPQKQHSQSHDEE